MLYQVYPRSFQDSDGDGVGDLPGILQRLDYLAWLGIDAIWISPIFPSPMADFGYDVADYTAVDPLFGTMADLDALVSAAHERGMRVLLDYVPNHSSDHHPWFVESRASRSSPKRDWYIWRDPAPDGGPPNDWPSMFRGSAWELDEQTGQYYFHAFLKEQPDLNWANPEVRAGMLDVMRFWFDRGIDGFRIDVLWLLAKGHEVEPFAVPSGLVEPDYSTARPGIGEIVAALRAVADEYDDRLLIGEVYLPLEQLVAFYGQDGSGIHLPFNFQLLLLPWQAADIHRVIVRYEGLLPEGAWPNWVLGNHDHARIASRVGAAQARAAAMLLLTLRGTPTIYYGDEIGMADVPIPAGEEHDPQGLRGGLLRDPARTPMRWQGGPTAGFCIGRPWLPIGPAVTEVNVAAQRDDPDSMLSLHRRLLALRRAEPAFSMGDWHDLGSDGTALAYLRTHGWRRFLVALNLGSGPSPVPVGARNLSGEVVATTLAGTSEPRLERRSGLAPDEGLIVLLDSGE